MATEKTQNLRAGDIAVKLPVVKIEDLKGSTFFATKFGTFTGRYGLSWRISCADATTGEEFLILMKCNDVRDGEFSDYARALQANPGARIGPLTVASVAVDAGDAWNLVDAD